MRYSLLLEKSGQAHGERTGARGGSTMASTEETIFEDLNFSTDRLSTQVRQISFGVLAIIWAILIGDANVGVNIRYSLALAALAVITMLLDLIQYVAAYLASRRALR